ncbi:MAG TPA: oligosaccharide flippase family protein [Longimicrobiales bacterium]|nr:oligosaccharide flippase family protein [Longimicrobiales bacterium]
MSSSEESGNRGEGLRARLGKQTAMYTLGLLAGRALSFLSLPIYTRLLTPADYGVIQLIEMTFDMLTILAGSRIGHGVFRFYHKATRDEDKKAVLSTALTVLFITFSVIAVGAWTSAEALSELIFGSERYATAIKIASLSFPWGGVMGVSMGYLRLKGRAATFVSLGLVKALIQLIVVMILLGGLGWDLTGVFVGTLVANTIVGGGVVAYLIKSAGIGFQAKAARDLIRFGLPLVVTQVATFFTTFGDRYFLQNAVGEAAVGIYALAYSFGFLLFQLGYSSFDQVWGPMRFEVANRTDREVVLQRVFLIMNVLLVTSAVGISIFVFDLLRIMSPAEYWGAADFVPVILVAYLFQGWSAFLDLGILVREETRYVTYANWAAAALAGLGYWFLIPIIGGWGAAFSTAAAFGLRALLINRFAQRLWPVHYEWAPVRRLLAVGVVTVGLSLFIPFMPLVPSLAIRSVVMLVFVVIVWNMNVLPPEEVEVARRKVRELWAAVRRRGLGWWVLRPGSW